MTPLEKLAKKAINKARSHIREQQNQLNRVRPISMGKEHRIEELQALLEILEVAGHHCDPHDLIMWEFQTPLPF